MKKFLIIVLLCASLASATTRYIAFTAGVFSGGTACNGQTAITPATWNGITNAGDDIVWICGTLTGGAGATMFTPLGNGTSGHPITINWDTGAILTAPYWSTTNAAINMTGHSWYVFDGKGTGNPALLATGGNPATSGANGIIQCTANGTSLANQQDSLMVLADGSSHLTFQNLWFKNNYVRVANTSGGTGFNSAIITATNATDILVTHNWATNARTLLGDAFTANGQNFEASFNYTFAVEVPLALATVSANVTWTSALTHDNHWAGGVDQWDDPTSNSFHHDGCCHFFAQASGAHINGWRNYNNLTDGVWGNDLTYFNSSGGTHITAYVYPEQTGGDYTDFNNVIDTSAGTPKLTAADNGTIFCKCSTSPGMSCAVYNDTFIGQAANATYNIDLETDGTSSCFTAKNNIHINQGGPYYLGGGASSTITSRNNDFFGQGAGNWNLGTFAAWQSAGQDASPSVNGVDSKVNTSTYKLGSGSSAIGIGVNLTSLGIVALDVDAAGVARPASAAWDAGAYQFATATSSSATMQGNVTIKGNVIIP